jgi:hypothetical protein
MTGYFWSNGTLYDAMYKHVRARATDRQARLFMVACCRLKTAGFFDRRIPFSLEIAERCADDPAAEATANSIWLEWTTSTRRSGFEGDIARAISGAWQLLDEFPVEWNGDSLAGNANTAIAHAAFMSLREKPRECFTGGAGDAVQYCARAIERAAVLEASEQEAEAAGIQMQRALADLLREIFGNPFRPATLDPRWRTATVVDLSRAIYEGRKFDDMPILADALMDAGCDSDELLSHCHEGLHHVRGCWVVDLILSKDR